MSHQKLLSPTLIKLINELNDGQYHDGISLGRKLNMTRHGIWKAIERLKAYDVKIKAVKGKGYCLLEPFILLDKEKISASLTDLEIDLSVFESLSSTNDYLKKKNNHEITSICIAEHQTKGRGRFQRNWYSPFGENIYLSCGYFFSKDAHGLNGLNVVVALAIIKTLETFNLSKSLFIKWPNDIIYDHKKIAGILIEVAKGSQEVSRCIIGIGLNVNLLHKPDLPFSHTSLRKITGAYVDRNPLCGLLIKNLLCNLQSFNKLRLKNFLSQWHAYDYFYQQPISLKMGTASFTGKAYGIDNQGHLILKLLDGTIQSFPSGEASIVKSN